jgi:type I restriction enzyme R subunit
VLQNGSDHRFRFPNKRRIGNQAVHEYHNDLDDAQMCLRLGFRLAVWYYRLVTKDYDFLFRFLCCPSTVRIATTRKSSRSNSKEQQTQEKYKARRNWKPAAEVNCTNGYIAVLEGKQQETEAQTKARVAALEAQLAAKNAELAKQTEQERKAYHKEITDQAIKRTLNLSEEESLPD